MPRFFDKFPQDMVCPLCGTSDDRECFLAPLDGTDQGNICEAVPVHRSCAGGVAGQIRVNLEVGIFYGQVCS